MRPVLLLLLLSACARGPAPPPADPGPSAPLARAALAEWEAWGRLTVEGWEPGRPADTAATPARFDRLLAYWEAVPGARGVALRLERLRAAIAAERLPPEPAPEGEAPIVALPEDIATYARPAWSAAFVTAVARAAGIPESDLPPATAHARYVDAVLARALAAPEDAAFLPFAPGERAPRPGDLLCSDRAPVPLAHWSLRLAARGRFRPMHCDIVVGAAAGRVDLVGGNVRDLVLLRRLPADAGGHLLPPPPGEPVPVLLLAARGAG